MILKNKSRVLLIGTAVASGFAFSNFIIRNSYKVDYPSKNNVTITFKNIVNGAPMILRDTSYLNPFEEPYTIKKFKYYISNVRLNYKGGYFKEINSYHLIDQNKITSLSFSFKAKNQNYGSISFLLGVDSVRNISGAQTGALDPTNDMFWTWNSGYVMAKMEGNSSSSALVNNMFEYHIGGFAGENKVLKTITLQFPGGQPLKVSDKNISKIMITADANAWWQKPNEIRIASSPGITSPGLLAKKISENYCNMFTISAIKNPE